MTQTSFDPVMIAHVWFSGVLQQRCCCSSCCCFDHVKSVNSPNKIWRHIELFLSAASTEEFLSTKLLHSSLGYFTFVWVTVCCFQLRDWIDTQRFIRESAQWDPWCARTSFICRLSLQKNEVFPWDFDIFWRKVDVIVSWSFTDPCMNFTWTIWTVMFFCFIFGKAFSASSWPFKEFKIPSGYLT
jgi:hypothetical protein